MKVNPIIRHLYVKRKIVILEKEYMMDCILNEYLIKSIDILSGHLCHLFISILNSGYFVEGFRGFLLQNDINSGLLKLFYYYSLLVIVGKTKIQMHLVHCSQYIAHAFSKNRDLNYLCLQTL